MDYCFRRDSFGYNFNNERGNNTNDYDKYLKKKEWYERNKDRLKEKNKKYKQNNREKISDMARKNIILIITLKNIIVNGFCLKKEVIEFKIPFIIFCVKKR
jgi:hypothetical protein